MKVVILAGGLGTRIRSISSSVPKPMIKVAGIPFLSHILTNLIKCNIFECILSVGYKSETIIGYYGSAWNNMKISYSIEKKPLGTGGAIRKSLNDFKDENYLIINGDTYFPINYNKFIKLHNNAESSLSIALKGIKINNRYGSVILNKNSSRVKKFISEPSCNNINEDFIINGGIYFLNKSEHIFEDDVFSFENYLMNNINKNINGFLFNEQFIDIGIPEDYNKANYLLNKKISI